MKTVVSHIKPADTVLSQNASIEKFYGVEVSVRQRGFISQYLYHKGAFSIRSLDGLTYCNTINEESLQKAIDASLAQGWRVFEFDTAKELFMWMFDLK